MKSKLISDAPERTFALILDRGDEVVQTLEGFAVGHGLTASRLSAIGAFERATLGYFDLDRRDYDRIEFDEQLEVLSMLGDFALAGDWPKLHAHVVLGRRDGSAVGGHLLEATVRPTLEVLLIESPGHLRRVYDVATGLALIDIDASDA